jgi:thymidylate synthase
MTIKGLAWGIGDAWFLLLRELIINGKIYTIQRGSFAGQKRLELDFVALTIEEPSMEMVPIMPEGSGIPPVTDWNTIQNYLCYLMTNAKQENEQYTYGERLAPQIPIVINMLRSTPNTNQACMEVGQPSDILLEDPPCLRCIKLKVRNNYLHMTTFWRSWDLWGALPTNLGGLQLLKQYIADEVGVKDGNINIVSDGLHIYDYAFEWAETRTKLKIGGG